MHIFLPESLTNYIHSQMASGLYRDPSELISQALQQKILMDKNADASLALLRHEVMLGWDQAERGECTPLDVAALKRDLDTDYHG